MSLPDHAAGSTRFSRAVSRSELIAKTGSTLNGTDPHPYHFIIGNGFRGRFQNSLKVILIRFP